MAQSNSDARIRTIELSDPEFERDGVRFITAYSPALGGRADISVFATPGIESLSQAPVVLLLHGVYGSHWAWFFKGGAHRTAQNLAAAGRIRPVLLVAPSDGLYRDGSGYLRHPGADYEAWIVRDVPDVVFRTFPYVNRNSPVFIAGLSMGGFGALRLGAKHAGVFRGISAHSAITSVEEMSSFLFEPFPVGEIGADEANILCWYEKNRDTLPPLRLDCGLDDALIEGNRRLHDKLKQSGIAHQYFEREGYHSWTYWRTAFASTLLFFEEILRNGAGDPT
jgi:putative tributyrin esterase